MLAPTQKSNDTIQILVTRKCDLYWCSNCTQLLPFRRDAVEMSPDVFRAALRSLEDWPGIRGIFGGNPCTHSRFADLMQILVEEVPNQSQRGIWTNNLMEHGRLVRDVFYPDGRFNCNAHADSEAAAKINQYLPGKLVPGSDSRKSWHSPILMDWRDMGISEADWIAQREACDINQRWSAGICERNGRPYAYFCEVGMALDGIRGENHGIEAVPGWWRLGMDGFGDQVKQCCDRGCGVPLKLRGHLDRDDTYDVSAAFVGLSVRGKRLRIERHERLPQTRVAEATDYMRLRTPA